MPGALYSPSMQAEIAKADNWYPMIANANPNIVSIDKLWQTTRDTPFYTPREAFRIAARGTLDQDSILGIVNALPEDSIISRRFFKTGYQRMQKPYLYVLSWEGTHSETGEAFSASTAVWSDTTLTTTEIYDQGGAGIGRGSPPLELFDLSVNFTAMYHQSGGAW